MLFTVVLVVVCLLCFAFSYFVIGLLVLRVVAICVIVFVCGFDCGLLVGCLRFECALGYLSGLRFWCLGYCWWRALLSVSIAGCFWCFDGCGPDGCALWVLFGLWCKFSVGCWFDWCGGLIVGLRLLDFGGGFCCGFGFVGL